jgi:threonine dehydratase
VAWPVERVTRTAADGVRHTSVGPLGLAHLRRYVDRIVTVTEAQIADAMRVLAAEARLVVEFSGAVALAARLAGAGAADRHAVCVASGGNVDLAAFARVLAAAPAGPADTAVA